MNTKDKLIEAIALMDEAGRGNAEGNSVMLWKDEWSALRKSLLDCLRDDSGTSGQWIERIKVHNEDIAILRRDMSMLQLRVGQLENNR